MMNKRTIKKNIIILYFSCIACITIGLSDFTTNTQTFASELLGVNIVVGLSMLRYVAPVILIMGISVLQKIRQKYLILLFETVNAITYFIMGLLAYFEKLTGIWIILILITSIIVEKVLNVVWPEIEIALVPMNLRRKYFGNSRFLLTMFTVIGLVISTVILKHWTNYKGFGILFMLSAIINAIFIIIYSFMDDSKIEKDKKKIPKFEYKNIVEDLKNDDFRSLFLAQTLMGIGGAITTIYSLIAITKGYKPYEVAIMGIFYLIIYALSDAIIGAVKIRLCDIYLFSSIILIVSYLTMYLETNMYFIFASLGMAQAGIKITELNLLGVIGEKRELEYVSIFSLTEIFAAIGLAVIAWLMEKYGLNSAISISIIFVVCATMFVPKIKLIEKKMKCY